MRTLPQTAMALALAGVAALSGGRLSAQTADSIRICLAPATVEASNNVPAAIDAVRESFTAYLAGPSLGTTPLKARLESQAKEEARLAACPYTLYTTLKLETKRSGGSMLGQVAAGAAKHGAYEAGAATGTTAGRIAGSAAYHGLNQAAYNYAVTIRNKDELTLGYRLEAPDGVVLVDQREKKSAKSDGEDLLSPLVQKAAEQIVAATKR